MDSKDFGSENLGGDKTSEKRPNPGVYTDDNSIVTARGTGDGLILRIDGKADGNELRIAVNDFLSSRKSFVENQSILIEWLDVEPADDVTLMLADELKDNFSITIKSTVVKNSKPTSKTSAKVMSIADRLEDRMEVESRPTANSRLGLFGGIGQVDELERGNERKSAPKVAQKKLVNQAPRAIDNALWDDADTRLICKTLRSGQKIETEHSLVIVGDVNSGAELIAGGDIIVLGAMRGVAHAGAFDETGGGRFIFALDLQPTQLRIGSIISRGAGSSKSNGAELARVDGNIITVEPYATKTIAGLRR